MNSLREYYHAKLKPNKMFWLAVSFVSAIVIWFFVTSNETTSYTRTINNIPVEYLGEEDLKNRDMMITDKETSSVSIRITGPRKIVATLRAEDMAAQVNVSKLTNTTYTTLSYTLAYPDGVNQNQITVNAKYPESISFTAAKITSKTVQVRGSFNGSPASGFVAEQPQFDPEVITITGPETYVKNVAYAWVTFGEDGVDRTYTSEAGITLMGADGQEASREYLTLSDESVIATLPIKEVKDVPITINLIDGGGATASMCKVTIEPASVTLSGDTSILADINKINLGTISLADFDSVYEKTYILPIEDGLTNMTGATEVHVKVEIMGLTIRNFTVKDFVVENVAEGYEYDVITESLTVRVRGTKEALDELENDMITAVADAADLKDSAGTWEREVRFVIDSDGDAGVMDTHKISIELRKAEINDTGSNS